MALLCVGGPAAVQGCQLIPASVDHSNVEVTGSRLASATSKVMETTPPAKLPAAGEVMEQVGGARQSERNTRLSADWLQRNRSEKKLPDSVLALNLRSKVS